MKPDFYIQLHSIYNKEGRRVYTFTNAMKALDFSNKYGGYACPKTKTITI